MHVSLNSRLGNTSQKPDKKILERSACCLLHCAMSGLGDTLIVPDKKQAKRSCETSVVGGCTSQRRVLVTGRALALPVKKHAKGVAAGARSPFVPFAERIR